MGVGMKGQEAAGERGSVIVLSSAIHCDTYILACHCLGKCRWRAKRARIFLLIRNFSEIDFEPRGPGPAGGGEKRTIVDTDHKYAINVAIEKQEV